MFNVQIPLPPVDEKKKVIEDVDKDRRYAIDASIVRIMKSRKVLGHQQLVLECVEHLISRQLKRGLKTSSLGTISRGTKLIPICSGTWHDPVWVQHGIVTIAAGKRGPAHGGNRAYKTAIARATMSASFGDYSGGEPAMLVNFVDGARCGEHKYRL
ncbi:hypothetical protein Patl1_25100 [Pistacia atlantica]|uniref:Uncharacterized protein n=1 Tax=Pistacia atlantica TaxID=434234 RepID=A0ACC1B3X8_9ROSI|nr:hypothetical protein Patl1_25100 [Pistacia atlantica]